MNELMTVPPVQIGAWLACLAFTVMLANGLVKLWASVRGKPAPGELSERLTKAEATLGEHSRRLKALEKNDQALSDLITTSNQTLRDLILAENDKLYERINAVAKDLYSLNGMVEALIESERRRVNHENHA